MKRQIILALTAIFLLFSIGVGVAVYNLFSTTADLRYIVTLHEIEDIRQDLHFYVHSAEELVNVPSEDLDEKVDEIVRMMHKINESVPRCQTCHHDPGIQAELLETQSLVESFGERFSFLITSPRPSSWQQENKRLASLLATEILHKVQDMITRASFTIKRKTNLATQSIDRSYSLLLVSLFVTFIIAFFIAQHLTGKVTRPVEVLLNATRKVRDGELGYLAEYPATAEFRELLRTFNEMSTALAAKEEENSSLYTNLAQKMEELKRTQRQLVEAEKLTALGTMAGGIAHDFNNILCGILSNIALLKRRQIPADQEENILDIVEKAGFRASKLVQQLLTFAQQTKWDITNIDINEHVEATVELLAGTFPENITIAIRLTPGMPKLRGDSTRIEQVLTNLIINARDAMNEGGTITITTRLVDPDKETDGFWGVGSGKDHILVEIEDTGTGISEEVLPRIFEPFFTTKPFGKGTGLGLAMVHGIVKGHNGFCQVDNIEPHGARFSIFLPV